MLGNVFSSMDAHAPKRGGLIQSIHTTAPNRGVGMRKSQGHEVAGTRFAPGQTRHPKRQLEKHEITKTKKGMSGKLRKACKFWSDHKGQDMEEVKYLVETNQEFARLVMSFWRNNRPVK